MEEFIDDNEVKRILSRFFPPFLEDLGVRVGGGLNDKNFICAFSKIRKH